MGLRVNNNIAAFNSYRNLQATDKTLNSSLEKLSSGLRINKAADDAAGLVISEGLRSQIGGLTVAARNAQDGVNVAQTADGALSTSTTILQRMRDLAVQSSNDTNDTKSRAAIQSEVDSLTAELTRISDKASFNGVSLLDGTFASKVFQVGYASGDTITVDIKSGATAAGTVAAVSGVTGTKSVWTSGSALAAATQTGTWTIDSQTVNVTTGDSAAVIVGKINTALGSTRASLDGSGKLVIQAAAVGTATFNVADGTATAPTGSSAAGTAAVTAVKGQPAVKADSFSAGGLGLGALDLTTQSNASTAIATIDAALATVSKARAAVGALQNRFEQVISSVNVSIENLTASESAIRDTDMAAEMTKFTRSQILSQAGTSMLAQANSSQQNVLSLLRG
ncbi:flagellin [Kineococcus sp. T13]|uniref:flagellin N-terminal helical domain-containing protein n=1 Tax=Kineococcus vitellinus TaxID=2696565 RepID=UPI001412D653|nr:flagellin [Kineococcus vitellinus]NAZ74709.1 flagellin [Kineococcus vitellinus]